MCVENFPRTRKKQTSAEAENKHANTNAPVNADSPWRLMTRKIPLCTFSPEIQVGKDRLIRVRKTKPLVVVDLRSSAGIGGKSVIDAFK